MKRIYFIKLFLLVSLFIHAQTVNFYTSVFTHNSTIIEAAVCYTLTNNQYNSFLSSVQNNYPNATILENPTSQYNCHSYAYHLPEGSFYRVWINQFTSTSGANISKYWGDGSFIEVCNESDADAVFYYNGDHSARTTGTSGVYQSKWGASCRVIHAYNYCPYDIPYYNRKYYASTKISGNIFDMCSGSGSFSVKSISGASYSWSGSSNLTVTGSANTASVTVNSPGSAWVEVTVTTACSGTSATTLCQFRNSSTCRAHCRPGRRYKHLL